MKLTPVFNIHVGHWIIGKVDNHQAYPLTDAEVNTVVSNYTRWESAVIANAKDLIDLRYEAQILREANALLEERLKACQPSPTPSSPSTAHAQSAADPATPPPAAPPVELGQLSAEQLQLLDKYLLDPSYSCEKFGLLSTSTVAGIMSLLWKIVRPAAMKAAGISSSEPTPKHGSWGSNA